MTLCLLSNHRWLLGKRSRLEDMLLLLLPLQLAPPGNLGRSVNVDQVLFNERQKKFVVFRSV